MCGICGIISFDAKPVQEERLHHSCEAMRHRGPDHVGTFGHAGTEFTVGLGAVRLAVQDPSALGRQPMLDRDQHFALVFNGEIYNFRDLRRELIDAGTHFVSHCDTEVVLHACIKWGPDAVHRFNGMWAIAFYDSQTQSGFLSRDRFGIKPLFYCRQNRELLWASEVRALAALGLRDRRIDPQALVDHVQFGFIGHPATIYKDVRRLAPGHSLLFDRRGPGEPVRYFDPLAQDDSGGEVDGDTRSALRRAMAEAVTARRVSDVPIGAFLSGGLDSSIIVAHLSEALGRRIKTFSVGYSGQASYDESAYARMVADRFGTEHHELVITEDDAVEAIPRVLDHLGEPVGDASIIPTALLSEFAAQSVTVALSGDGADELFGGYWRYLGHSTLNAYRAIPRIVREYLIEPSLRLFGSSKSSLIGNRVRQIRKLLRTGDPNALARHIAWSRILAPEFSDLLVPTDRSIEADRNALQRAKAMTESLADSRDPLAGILAYDLLYQLPADMLHKVDLAGMMHSLEVRVPFLDPALVRMALALPSSAKIHRGMRKRVLVEAYRGRLPDPVLDRPKQGFELPIGEFLRNRLRDLFHDTVDRETVESIGLLSYDAIQSIYEQHLNRRAEHADVLFSLLSLCWWWRRERSRTTQTQ
ncbi:MAG: asparagine synthase (glutamine-hydrolyzing) [Planctomycetes bacterium]|nr:asparagine synthase (glutamine-hydrolyzing) [Planctomycetota bacterium]